MLDECLNMFRNRGMEIVRKIPRVQRHHLTSKCLLKVISYAQWRKGRFQILQSYGEMENPLRHVTEKQRKDACVDVAFWWLLLYAAYRPSYRTHFPCPWSCLLQFTTSPEVRPETTLIIEVRNTRLESNGEIILHTSWLISVCIDNALTLDNHHLCDLDPVFLPFSFRSPVLQSNWSTAYCWKILHIFRTKKDGKGGGSSRNSGKEHRRMIQIYSCEAWDVDWRSWASSDGYNSDWRGSIVRQGQVQTDRISEQGESSELIQWLFNYVLQVVGSCREYLLPTQRLQWKEVGSWGKESPSMWESGLCISYQ